MIRSWSDRYVGIPWSREDLGARGTHCGGLVRLVYAERLGIVIEDVGPAGERAENAAALAARRSAWPWRVIPTAEAQPYDVIVYRDGAYEDHVGIVVTARLMLHVAIGREAIVEEISGPAWRDRIVAVHRHAARMEGGDV